MSVRFFYEIDKTYGYTSDIVKDLNLTWIARNMAQTNYNDVQHILDVIIRPLTDPDEICKRQRLVEAACDHLDLTEKLRKCIVEMKGLLDQSMSAILDSRSKHLMEQTVIGIHRDAVTGLVEGIARLHQLISQYPEVFEDTEYHLFAETFLAEEPVELLREQQELTLHLDSFKDKGAILMEGTIGGGFALDDVKVMSVSEKAGRVMGGIFSGRRGQVINDAEVYQSGVEFTNRVLMELLDKCVPFLQRWQKILSRLQRQIMFLAGCSRLHKRALECDMYFCMPKVEEIKAECLYELSLALQTLDMPIHNTTKITRYQAIIVTGANQGGKSTFLRSLGIAQVMCQAGMYVPAKTYPLRIYTEIFTHFTRREDVTMNMGKFEEELKRMEDILKCSGEGTLILLNESFATTTEVTAYQIAMDLLHVCLEHQVTVWMVTHITKFARELYREERPEVLFLSAGRQAEEEIQFMMYDKEPSDTSY